MPAGVTHTLTDFFSNKPRLCICLWKRKYRYRDRGKYIHFPVSFLHRLSGIFKVALGIERSVADNLLILVGWGKDMPAYYVLLKEKKNKTSNKQRKPVH
jgi:hypothetical protein